MVFGKTTLIFGYLLKKQRDMRLACITQILDSFIFATVLGLPIWIFKSGTKN